jgi:hypothetical protein
LVADREADRRIRRRASPLPPYKPPLLVYAESMETKTILSIGLIAGYTVTHVGLGADVPGKPLTVMTTVTVTASSTGTLSGSVIPNLANPYGSDFAPPAKDPRPGKVTT